MKEWIYHFFDQQWSTLEHWYKSLEKGNEKICIPITAVSEMKERRFQTK